jgi:hypothetical protein
MGKNIDNFTIGQTEEVIKTYLYHSVSSSDKEIGDSVKNLIVTTKRLILESKNNNGFTRDEFPIDMIDGVNTKFYQSKKSKIWLLLMILGIGFIGPAIGVKDILSNVFGGLVIILIALGALLFIGGLVYLIRKKRKQSFSLTFYSTKQLYDFSSVSAENFIIKERKQRKGAKPKQIKVLSKITPAAVVMLNQIHALIQDIKEFKNQVRLYKKMQLDKDLTALEYQERYDALLERLKDKYNS